MPYHDNFDMVLVTETWLHADISTGLLDPKSAYVILRKDRVGKGGRVCAFVRHTVNIMAVDIGVDFDALELVCFDVILNANKLRFFVVYRVRPPHNDESASCYLNLLLKCFTVFATNHQSNIIVGDFNCPGIDWDSFTSPNDTIDKLFLNYTPCLKKTVQNCFCQNFVKCPPILIIFSRKMAKRLKLCKAYSFSTSPNLRHHTTMLNADVLNCYNLQYMRVGNTDIGCHEESRTLLCDTPDT